MIAIPKKNAALTVALSRGPYTESRHSVHAVVMDGDGKTRAAYGDAKRLTFPRSALKPLQAVALVESGAAQSFGLSDAEIALACASHNGEALHVAAVGDWLARIGLQPEDLGCGMHAPYAHPSDAPCLLCNNCSGKHAGMLTLALHLGVDIHNYTDATHPVQQMILSVMTDLCGTPLTPDVCGIDGCSAPNPAMTLQQLAQGFAMFMRPDKAGFQRGTACRHIYQAMVEHPVHVAGEKARLDTVLMRAAGGKIMSKTGAEGAYIAVIPAKDIVIALKAEDGAGRAAQAALAHLLQVHDLADAAVVDAIAPLCLPVLKNWRGTTVGETTVN